MTINSSEKDIIIGTHSIVEAIKNPQRRDHHLYLTDTGLQKLQKDHGITLDWLKERTQLQVVDETKFNAIAQQCYQQKGHTFQKIVSKSMLTSSSLELRDPHWLRETVASHHQCGKRLKILALDGVTDVHNGAAITRTAAFYGVDILLLPQSGNFGFSPSFYRIASGAAEHISVVVASHLPKTMRMLKQLDCAILGFSEHSALYEVPDSLSCSICIVVGNEETGLSHAMTRELTHLLAIRPHGKIQSLNVSVATAVAIERFLNF